MAVWLSPEAQLLRPPLFDKVETVFNPRLSDRKVFDSLKWEPVFVSPGKSFPHPAACKV